MSDPEYLPIPAHIYTLACALVTTRREEESPVVIRVEVLSCGESDSAAASSSAAGNIYPVSDCQLKQAACNSPEKAEGLR